MIWGKLPSSDPVCQNIYVTYYILCNISAKKNGILSYKPIYRDIQRLGSVCKITEQVNCKSGLKTWDFFFAWSSLQRVYVVKGNFIEILTRLQVQCSDRTMFT